MQSIPIGSYWTLAGSPTSQPGLMWQNGAKEQVGVGAPAPSKRPFQAGGHQKPHSREKCDRMATRSWIECVFD